MGCDIHVYLEYKNKDDDRKTPWWQSFGGHINPGRDYDLFGNLAGIRGGDALIEPRGLPDHLAWHSNRDAHFIIDDGAVGVEGYCTRQDAESWSKYGSKILERNGITYVTNPDWHSHSWLTCDEFQAAMDATDQVTYNVCDSVGLSDSVNHECDPEYHALMAAARTLESRGKEVRLVFWFDN